MSKIIDIEERLKQEQQKKLQVDRAKKREMVRKILQCTRCLSRCVKCGLHFETQQMYKRYKGFRFCDSCQEEYDEYLRLTQGQGEPRYPWHNRQWRRTWETWLAYQQALKEYGESPEFLDLVREVEWEH